MAYINEYVEKENRRTFILPYGKKVTPGWWTIDKEKDNILFEYFEDREPPHDEYFAFYYQGYVMKIIARQTFRDPNIIRWRVLSMSIIPKELKKEEVMKELEKHF